MCILLDPTVFTGLLLLQVLAFTARIACLYVRAFHHFCGLRDKELPKKHPELDRLLREEYRSLEDFHAKKKSVRKESR